MQDIAQRREASLQYYREQYDSAHPQPPPTSASSSRPGEPSSRYTDGEDEIDSAGVAVSQRCDEVDCVQSCLTRANISRASSDHL